MGASTSEKKQHPAGSLARGSAFRAKCGCLMRAKEVLLSGAWARHVFTCPAHETSKAMAETYKMRQRGRHAYTANGAQRKPVEFFIPFDAMRL